MQAWPAPTVVSVGTGIVFIVLVAIWLAYFVQYWSRRREHLATARSVEAFSEAMRVLERRPAPRIAGNDRISTAYAVSPARVVARPAPRPQVIAKPRPAPATSGGDSGMRLNMSVPKSASALAGSARESLSRAARSAPGRRPAGSRPPARSGAPVPSRKVRGLTLLTALAATLVLGVLAAFSVVVWWVPLIAVVAVVGSFFWLRSAVQAEIRARRAARTRARRARSGRAVAPGARSAGARSAAPQAPAGEEHDVADPFGDHELAEDSTVLAADAVVVAPSADTDAEAAGGPGGWQPVPVPPPTYTLKAKAERPSPIVADDDIPEAPQFAEGAATDHPLSDSGGDSDATDQRAAYGT